MAEPFRRSITIAVATHLALCFFGLPMPGLGGLMAAQPYEFRPSDPLQQPWRISRYSELQGRGPRCIAETADGHLWFGLTEGIVEYDGRSWIKHGRNVGLPPEPICSIAVREDGSLVAATEHAIFQRHKGQWNQLFPTDDTSAFGAADLAINQLAVTTGNVLWVCSMWGLIRHDQDTTTLFSSEEYLQTASKLGWFDAERPLPSESLPQGRHLNGLGFTMIGHRVAQIDGASPAKAAGLRAGDVVIEANGGDVDRLASSQSTPNQSVTLAVQRFDSGQIDTLCFEAADLDGRHRDPSTFSLIEDSQGTIWLGTRRKHMLTSDDSGNSWRPLEDVQAAKIGGRPALLETSDERIRIVSSAPRAGVSSFDGSNWSHDRLMGMGAADFASSAAKTTDGTIWVSALNRLHVHVDGQWKTHDTRDLEIPSDSHRMMVASDDSLWIVGYNQYAVRIAMAPKEFVTLRDAHFHCTDRTGARWYIDSTSKRIVQQTGNRAVSFGSEDDAIEVPLGIVAVPNIGVVAFGSHDGTAAVSAYDGRTWTRRVFPAVAESFSAKGHHVTRDNRVWLSAKLMPGSDRVGGIVAGVGDDWQHHTPPLAPSQASVIAELPNGKMLLAGNDGIVFFDGHRWSAPTDSRFEGTVCPSGTIDADGTVWLATRTRGVLRYRDDRWQSFTSEDGLLSNDVGTIAVGRVNDVWASTIEGLCRYDGTRFYAVDIPQRFGRRSIQTEADGRVWFDRTHCYTFDNQAPIAKFDTESLSIEPNTGALVTWSGRDAWNRTPANRLTWSHQIDDGRWTPFQHERQVVLNDLPPGSHVIRLRARDSDFNVSPVTESSNITVLPLVYKRAWFVGLASVCSGILVWLSSCLIGKGIQLRRSNRHLEQARSQLAQRYAHKSAQFRAICDCSPIGIFVTDGQGQVTYLNRYLERLCEISQQEAIDSAWTDSIHPDDRERVCKSWHEAVRERRSYQCSGRLLRRDGTVEWFDVAADRMESDGEFLGYVGAVENMTRQVVASEKLKESNSKLRAAVDQLRHAQGQAIKRERLNALGQMAAGVAHDINNSLTPLLSYSELLAETTELQGDSRRWIDLIRLGVSDTASIVKRLEHFYHTSHNRDVLKTVELADLVTQSVELTRPKWHNEAIANGKQIQVQVDTDAHPVLSCDPAQIRSVLTNLIFNAVDAIEDRGVVSVRISQQDDRAILEVADDGSGMDDEKLNRCLEPFYTSKAKGSGLGLSECHGVVRQHGGSLDIDSQQGHGTRVRIGLPSDGANASNDSPSLTSETIQQRMAAGHMDQSANPSSTVDVLYVDDDAAVRRSTVAVLRSLGATVEAVEDGPSALHRLGESEFRVVMCDQGLPGMDGIAVLNEIKHNWPDLPVVIISGWALKETESGAKPDGFLEKPVALEDLVGLLQQYLPAQEVA